jgi:hypothetical protein
MIINPETKLFEDFSEEECKNMLSFVKDLIAEKEIGEIPYFVEQWMETFNYGEEHRYLLLATSFKDIVLNSIIINGKS